MVLRARTCFLDQVAQVNVARKDTFLNVAPLNETSFSDAPSNLTPIKFCPSRRIPRISQSLKSTLLKVQFSKTVFVRSIDVSFTSTSFTSVNFAPVKSDVLNSVRMRMVFLKLAPIRSTE